MKLDIGPSRVLGTSSMHPIMAESSSCAVGNRRRAHAPTRLPVRLGRLSTRRRGWD
ncbi:MAG: hypothetical protein KGL43_12255 [Burkholderiales bacterium]|nr:hypothetical protein [Burkholderiales bacterium]MDE2394443.1 hypothetical protein [Burkholderiales bacterium]MDE2454356.1 hypothetical protein [Burkholderiales bacterium]